MEEGQELFGDGPVIHVERGEAPELLGGENSSGRRERAAWARFFARKGAAEPKFQVYRYDAVKARLVEAFLGKCAYCESRIVHLTWGDIEHFRPKGAVIVDGKRKKPAYWWLAAEWTNLLLACNRCNSVNRQEVLGSDTQTIGKGNQFPLRCDERGKWPPDPGRWPGVELQEEPLLLDPCREDPCRSLYCGETGDEEGLLRWSDERGRQTVTVLGLNRESLVRQRRKKLKTLKMTIETVREVVRDLDRAVSPAEIERKEERLSEVLGWLAEQVGPDEEYLLMSRQVVDAFMASFEG